MGLRRLAVVCLLGSLAFTLFLLSSLNSSETTQRSDAISSQTRPLERIPPPPVPEPINSADVDESRPLLQEPDDDVDLAALAIVRTPEDEAAKKAGYEDYQFNGFLSDRIGEQRRIPDTRHAKCPSTFESKLPKASIIICFFNESPIVLLRMVTSILTRTPPSLIEEILLVDDSSEMDGAAEAARNAIQTRSEWAKVSLITTTKNEGLIRAKIFGAERAKGEVLVFLDSHCEVNQHWLEPLLERIKGDRKRFVTPIIDIIDSDDMRYIGSPVCYGGFDWGLTFKWDYPHRSLLANETFLISPLKSPTMAGGLFAVDKKVFFEYGSYDEGMDVWGAENVEISFRIWQCGASLEVIPCSRIGHIFRRKRPYGLATDTMGKNAKRAAMVWLDEFYPKFEEARPHLAHADYGDVSTRIALRQKLQCKPFRWFLSTIYPSLLPGNSYAADQLQDSIVANNGKYLLRLMNSSLCLWVDSSSSHVALGTALTLRACNSHRMATWKWSSTLELRSMGSARLCLDSLLHLSLMKCHQQGAHQEWHYAKDGRLFSSSSGKCLHFPDGRDSPARIDFCAIAEKFEVVRAV